MKLALSKNKYCPGVGFMTLEENAADPSERVELVRVKRKWDYP